MLKQLSESMEIKRYIFEEYIFNNMKMLSLLRIVEHHNIGLQGEEYVDGEWHKYNGALSYLPDPSPAEFIDEARAIEVMKLIDKQ